ncbi:hypothetical protein K504DRAFT_371809 [Pleomassaria siparia CBS 279.74]|uniref:BZIP domain-containing protein n=1 Tax=Pleomassaria siparia CBS 279.74 TaxID=1314801 RepID=A0A6G1KIG1_9PLEO|nr:hypothetical protein K504DRAFT_371809 [Pleomassaria siparia CBS 279.74]
MPSSPILSSSSSSSSSSSPSSSFPSSSSPSSSLSSPTSTTSTSTPARRKSRVSAEHTLTRVRENQRRHRARRRDYIHTLEVQLAETELHLEAARREIDGLRAEREGWRDKDGETTPTPPIDPALPPSTTPTLLTNPRTRSIPASTPSTGPECSTCATRPLPSPNESTTLCSQAYMLISQQNFRGIDPATIRLWLRQGYRRARRSGEGCTVENGVLMGVLDFISGEL